MTSLYFRIAAGIALAVGLVVGLQWWTSSIEHRGYERGRAEVQALRDKDALQRAGEDTARVRATLRQSEVNREEETRREAAKQQEIDRAQEHRRSALAAAKRADRAADGLRVQLATFVDDARSRAAASADPGAADRGETAAAPIVVLADVLRRADARAGELAKAVDAARGAGLSCERSADALNAGNQAPSGRSSAAADAVKAN